ncbi:MAG: hypothetical protein QOE32_4581, partial [Pseudonocardiales bacterium]|nr:hypothetical protein [Pseudonocardiales bacterium]
MSAAEIAGEVRALKAEVAPDSRS